jgi:hypothetical protein
MPASPRPFPPPRSRACPWPGACLVALALGCTKTPKTEPGTNPGEATAGPEATAKADSPTPPSGPRVLFAVSDGVLAPLLCHDGRELLQNDSTECMGLAPAGDPAVLDTGARVTLAEPIDAPCNGIEASRFEGRLAREGLVDDGSFAVWPATASTALTLRAATLSPSAEELAAMVALLEQETQGLFEVPPKLEPTGGLVADLDADGEPDRVLATFEQGRLYGVIAVFLGRDPKTAVPLSILQFDAPRIVGITDLDGRPGDEVLVDAVFVEGIEDQDVVSAISRRVLALHDGAAAPVGSWGCRMF